MGDAAISLGSADRVLAWTMMGDTRDVTRDKGVEAREARARSEKCERN